MFTKRSLKLPAWRWFATWSLVGATAATGVLAVFTIGLPLLLAAAAGATILLRRGHTAGALGGLVAGAAAPAAYVAYLNRGGPGDVCNAARTSCQQEFNPLVWLGLAAAALVLGVALFLATEKQRRRQ